MLDMQTIAGNLHISVHGLNVFIAEKVNNLMPYDFSTFVPFGSEVWVLSEIIAFIRSKFKLLKKLNSYARKTERGVIQFPSYGIIWVPIKTSLQVANYMVSNPVNMAYNRIYSRYFIVIL